MQLRSAMAGLLALALPLATPAAAWAVEQCCAAGPLATLVAPTSAPSGHCHEAPAVVVDDGATLAVEVGAAGDCRMDHLALRGAVPAPDAAAGVVVATMVSVVPAAADASVRTVASDRGPPALPDLNLLHGILRI